MIRTFASSFTTASMAASVVQKLQSAGVHKLRSYGPYPDELLLSMTTPVKSSKIPFFALVGGLTGAAAGFYL